MGAPPTTFTTTHIEYSVPIIPQGSNPICWIACAAMLTSWQTNATHSIAEFTGGFDPSNACLANPPGWDTTLQGWGFTTVGASSLEPNFIWDILVANGPFMFACTAANFPFSGIPICSNVGGAHAMVVNGMDTGSNTVLVLNPWGNVVAPVDAGTMLNLMQAYANGGQTCAAYFAGAGPNSSPATAAPSC
jgi:hypothetical protein